MMMAGVFLIGCIGDDFVDDEVDAVLRITSVIDTIAVDSQFQFEAVYLNNVGMSEEVEIEWGSSNSDIISIDAQGLASAHKIGSVYITAAYNDQGSILLDSISVAVDSMSSGGGDVRRTGTIRTTSSYLLEGGFDMIQDGNDVLINIHDDYRASTALPGLYVYLTNNPNTSVGALEIGRVTTFSGRHSYTVSEVGVNDYNYILYFCKPFNVKVGDGEIQ